MSIFTLRQPLLVLSIVLTTGVAAATPNGSSVTSASSTANHARGAVAMRGTVYSGPAGDRVFQPNPGAISGDKVLHIDPGGVAKWTRGSSVVTKVAGGGRQATWNVSPSRTAAVLSAKTEAGLDHTLVTGARARAVDGPTAGGALGRSQTARGLSLHGQMYTTPKGDKFFIPTRANGSPTSSRALRIEPSGEVSPTTIPESVRELPAGSHPSAAATLNIGRGGKSSVLVTRNHAGQTEFTRISKGTATGVDAGHAAALLDPANHPSDASRR